MDLRKVVSSEEWSAHVPVALTSARQCILCYSVLWIPGFLSRALDEDSRILARSAATPLTPGAPSETQVWLLLSKQTLPDGFDGFDVPARELLFWIQAFLIFFFFLKLNWPT